MDHVSQLDPCRVHFAQELSQPCPGLIELDLKVIQVPYEEQALEPLDDILRKFMVKITGPEIVMVRIMSDPKGFDERGQDEHLIEAKGIDGIPTEYLLLHEIIRYLQACLHLLQAFGYLVPQDLFVRRWDLDHVLLIEKEDRVALFLRVQARRAVRGRGRKVDARPRGIRRESRRGVPDS